MVNKRMQTLLMLLRQQGIHDERLLQAIEAVPRERFVDEALSHKVYENTALPIGSGQTISQPYMVARMTELLQLTPTRHGDGWLGWASRGPFDAIIVTAAPPEIPSALLEQLDDGGILVLPVGEQAQTLKCVQRRNNEFQIETVEAVRFVPLVKGELA